MSHSQICIQSEQEGTKWKSYEREDGSTAWQWAEMSVQTQIQVLFTLTREKNRT